MCLRFLCPYCLRISQQCVVNFPFSDGEYYEYYDECSPIIDAVWAYTVDDTRFFSDADNTFNVGDTFIFDGSEITVSIDDTIIADGTMAGTCTVSPTLTAAREYCVLTFDFGDDYGTIAVQGPLEEMAIVGTTGCFWWYTGNVLGFTDGAVYDFTVDAYAR